MPLLPSCCRDSKAAARLLPGGARQSSCLIDALPPQSLRARALHLPFACGQDPHPHRPHAQCPPQYRHPATARSAGLILGHSLDDRARELQAALAVAERPLPPAAPRSPASFSTRPLDGTCSPARRPPRCVAAWLTDGVPQLAPPSSDGGGVPFPLLQRLLGLGAPVLSFATMSAWLLRRWVSLGRCAVPATSAAGAATLAQFPIVAERCAAHVWSLGPPHRSLPARRARSPLSLLVATLLLHTWAERSPSPCLCSAAGSEPYRTDRANTDAMTSRCSPFFISACSPDGGGDCWPVSSQSRSRFTTRPCRAWSGLLSHVPRVLSGWLRRLCKPPIPTAPCAPIIRRWAIRRRCCA